MRNKNLIILCTIGNVYLLRPVSIVLIFNKTLHLNRTIILTRKVNNLPCAGNALLSDHFPRNMQVNLYAKASLCTFHKAAPNLPKPKATKNFKLSYHPSCPFILRCAITSTAILLLKKTTEEPPGQLIYQVHRFSREWPKCTANDAALAHFISRGESRTEVKNL